MIEIQDCDLVDQVCSSPTFELVGNNDLGEFHCRVEVLLTDGDVDPNDDVEFEHIDGVDIGPETDEWEEFIYEITQTEAYREALEDFQGPGFGSPILE